MVEGSNPSRVIIFFDSWKLYPAPLSFIYPLSAALIPEIIVNPAGMHRYREGQDGRERPLTGTIVQAIGLTVSIALRGSASGR